MEEMLLTPLRERRKEKILVNSMRYFVHHGINDPTMEDIATSLNITRQTLYRYYSSKEELVFAIELRVLDRILSRINELFGVAAGLTISWLYENCEELILQFVFEYSKEFLYTGLFDAYLPSYTRPEQYEEIREILHRYPNPFTRIISSDVQFSESFGLPPEIIGETISNSLLSLTQRVLMRRETLQKEYGFDPIHLIPTQIKLLLRSMVPGMRL